MMRPKSWAASVVVDDAGRLVGIVTSVDLLDFFLDITGCWVEGAAWITVKLQDRAGRPPRCSPRSMRRAATSSRGVAARPQSEGLRTATIPLRGQGCQRGRAGPAGGRAERRSDGVRCEM